MIYRELGKTGCRVSQLGFGAMRLPVTEPDNSASIDEEKAVRMLRDAIDSGVNYIDTAFFYHDGRSENIVGLALQDGYREKTYLATKLPMGEVKETADFDRILGEQLNKLGTDHIDFYLFHALNEKHWETVKRLGLLEKMKQAKADGRIRHCGFSFHDGVGVFKKIVDEYDCCEFCQIQLNYLDTDHQAGIEGLEYAASKGLGVIIMEPLRGGRLASPDAEIAALLPQGKTPVENALAFIWDRKEVSLVLSGMSTPEQVKDNILYADRYRTGNVSAEDAEKYRAAKKAFDLSTLIPCTRCNYCQPCPQGVEIPLVFAAYNKVGEVGLRGVQAAMPDIEEQIDRCVKCGTCEEKCPQKIEITEQLRKISRRF